MNENSYDVSMLPLEHIQRVIHAALTEPGSLHPLIVHFPLVLLIIAPLFIILGLLFFKSSRLFFISAAILMILGTASTYLAIETGEKAAERAPNNPAVFSTLSHHYKNAEKTRDIFTVLTAIFIAALLIFLNKRFDSRVIQTSTMIIFVVAYTYGILILTLTADYGGKLVYEHSVHTDLYQK